MLLFNRVLEEDVQYKEIAGQQKGSNEGKIEQLAYLVFLATKQDHWALHKSSS